MAVEIEHFIKGTKIRPVNGDLIGIKIDWTGNAIENVLNVDSIVLANEAKQIVFDHINTIGVFEGIPYTVKIENIELNYYIDLTENAVINKDCGTIEVSIKKRKSIGSFMSQANALSFESINKTNTINTIKVPYLVVRDNQQELLIMLSLTTYSLVKALQESIQEVAEGIADLAAVLPPLPGNAGAIVAAAIKLAARIVYLAAVILALINTVAQLIDLIFPFIKNFKAATVKELIERGCEKLGYTFQSSIIDNLKGLTVLPTPFVRDSPSVFNTLLSTVIGNYTKGYPTAQDTTPTLGSLIEVLESQFNAKTRVLNGVVYLENENFWQQQSGVIINQTLTDQANRTNEFTFNTGESWRRYYLHYQSDISDIHTFDNIDGLDCEYSTEINNTTNADLVNIKGLVDVNINFALGSRKTSLNIVESAAETLAKLADTVAGVFGSSSNLQSKIKGRIGLLQISQQYFTTTKLLYAIGGKQPSNYVNFIGANNIYQNYHTQNQVKENFKEVYSTQIPFSSNDFLTLQNNNYLKDKDGNEIELLSFEWINQTKTAEITYSIPSSKDSNTKTILIND